MRRLRTFLAGREWRPWRPTPRRVLVLILALVAVTLVNGLALEALETAGHSQWWAIELVQFAFFVPMVVLFLWSISYPKPRPPGPSSAESGADPAEETDGHSARDQY